MHALGEAVVRLIGHLIVTMLLAVNGVWAADGFYKGKIIKLISGTSAGSGTDVHARLIQEYIGRHIPDAPSVILQNMPAGGGLAAINYVYNVARKDGTEIGLFNRNGLYGPILSDKTAMFKSELFNWIGTPASYADDAWVFLMRTSLPYKSFDEMRNATIPLNVGGVSGANPFNALMQGVFGVKMKFIIGYPASELALALERGEVDGLGNGYHSVLITTPDLLNKNIVRVMMQFGHKERLPALPNVPTGRELARTSDELALIELAEFGLTLGFPVAAPPDTPAEQVEALRTAFRELMKDPDYNADAQKAQLQLSPRYGAELQDDIIKMATTPGRIVETYKSLLNFQGPENK